MFIFKKKKKISSGSKAEGLDRPGSDLDLMFLLEEIVVDQTHSGKKEEFLVLDTENASPGFALIKVPESTSEYRDVKKSIIGCFLSNEYIKERAFSNASMQAEVMQKSFKIQGPSVARALTGVFDVDLVISLSCREWPNVARMWIQRNISSNLPSTNLHIDAIQEVVLLVPVGSKASSNDKENCFEWRLSFSLAEKLLIYSLNDCQLLCYALFKILLKEILTRKVGSIKCYVHTI